MKKMILGVLSLVLCGAVGLVGVVSQPVWADGDVCSDSSIPDDLKEAAGCNTTTTADSVVNNVLEIVSGVAGVIAVFVMIYGGFTYITSTGDSGKIARAKNIIIYGLVGLVVSC